jgi:EAL domain-containing protein (putative c-di-GMP-specific phosphodiesterase class I)
LENPALPSLIGQLLDEDPGVAGRLILEITESVAVTSFISTDEVLRTLQGMGCKLAIDDFGTGFSSLKYLKKLPVDLIKIDGMFVRDVSVKPDDQILVRAVIEFAQMFGKATVAEEVCTQEDCDWLQLQGLDFAQGYLIAPPMSRPDLYEFLRGRKSVLRTASGDQIPC